MYPRAPKSYQQKFYKIQRITQVTKQVSYIIIHHEHAFEKFFVPELRHWNCIIQAALVGPPDRAVLDFQTRQ